MEIESFIKQCSMVDGFLTLADHTYAAQEFAMDYRAVEAVALEMGIVPLRYQRNQSTISPQQQKTLFDSHIAIIGCGGLGGHTAEILTRIGIGKLSLYDFDHFEEHNLNRQNFCTIKNLGLPKALVVKEALEQINPSIQIEAHVQKFDPQKDFAAIQTCDLLIDALDHPPTKRALAQLCQINKKPFIHGAIGGLTGQVATSNNLQSVYRDSQANGAEHHAGNPAFNVTLIASLQASEAIKVILGIGEPLHDTLLVTDLLHNEFEKLPL